MQPCTIYCGGPWDPEIVSVLRRILIGRADSFEKTLILGKIKSKREREWQRKRCSDSITDSISSSLVAQSVISVPAMCETWVQSLAQEDPWRSK